MPVLPSLTQEIKRKTKVAFSTLGCKLNFSETSTIARNFDTDIFQTVRFHQSADIYVINTCSVTENAEKKLTGLVRKSVRSNPKAKIIVTGCFAQLQPQKVSEIEGVDLVVGAEKKFRLHQLVTNLSKNHHPEIHACEIDQVSTFKKSFSIAERTRAFLKIQDGCDYQCSFCTIPKARGKSRSDSIDNILQNIKYLKNRQVNEIVLTGVNIGDYGRINPQSKKREYSFFDLLKAIDSLSHCPRIRISSIEPNLLNDQIIDLVQASPYFVPHFHIPLQSGSDHVLKLMRRRYNTTLYAKRIEKIKKSMPDACVGVDVIVGFYGETDQEFEKTIDFINQLDISYLHVFTYSERPNTKAMDFELPAVPLEIRKQRRKSLAKLSDEKKIRFYQTQFNKTKTVLFESQNKEGYLTGYTENYLKVRTPWNPQLANQLVACKPIKIDDQDFIRAEF
ncbi:MAG: tRNA (N(6)-L-threonylcarbamoyladenosine(37)-C(2))-methylthiotransferase MtaB [Flavobacteriaceae bacterium]|nr:tRNA (N(6)-L-threonylcarbamoyladenosine(37)-C(2))-methylthiotransferase MtaB [Flavobacteriaceae bacterium]MCY4266556.1 tRNA (N(6)-L-threonylcarbamoyladenosine(37)-C(2))-methylthiotransferase MtaB [Flavobacteriaceae bacterium]MCY4300001.1 tRNA (N(6)-L-threonylcarbamoyladenosine(37)-C(2))-methylthiotransferase MtaB [Flavobacteriaceae bacterium]